MEKALIGAILQKNDILADVANIIGPADFTDQKALTTYELCLSRWKGGKNTDMVIAVNELGGKVDPLWLATATDGGTVTNSVNYAEQIAEKAKFERLKVGATRSVNEAFNSESLISSLSDLAVKESGDGDDIENASDCIESFSAMRKKGGLRGLSSGYGFLDNKFIKCVRGDYWAIGAATSVGKSSFAINVFNRLLQEHDAKVLMVSTEMTKHQVIARLIGCLTDIPSIHIINNSLRGQVDVEKVEKAERWLAKRKFFITEKIRDISEIENTARGLDIKHDLDVVFVDYLQHCRSREYKSQYDILSDVTGRLQNLSKQIEATTIGLNQLSNASARDPNGNLEFKGAGDIAADCDVGIILRKNKTDRSVLIADIRKNRHGNLGSQAMQYTKSFAMLEEIHHQDNW